MNDLTSQSWFGWAVAVVVGLPIVLIVLTELHNALLRRNSAMARPVLLLRNWAVPLGALLVLLTQTSDIDADSSAVRITATVFGVLVVVLVLSGLNVVLFSNAATGSWRQRLPSIFIDIFRIVLIGVALAVLFSWVWGANVGGLFAALGVTSIVLGLALQNSVGSIIAGLLLLFEQPFELGDWLDTGDARGRVVEVNWRAVHIETGNGTQIVPNASLAGSSFTNLSRPSGAHTVSVATTFATEDPPGVVQALLDRVAAGLTDLHPGSVPESSLTGPKSYRTTFQLRSPADTDRVTATFLRWLWYAARRAGLHLDGASDELSSPELAAAALRRFATTLHLDESEIEDLSARTRIECYGAGEIIIPVGVVPDALLFITAGRVINSALVSGGYEETDQLGPGDYLGATGVTREPTGVAAEARDDVTALRVPIAVIDELISERPAFAREVSAIVDLRHRRGDRPGLSLVERRAT